MIHIDKALKNLIQKDSLLKDFTNNLKLHLESCNKLLFSASENGETKNYYV